MSFKTRNSPHSRLDTSKEQTQVLKFSKPRTSNASLI